MKRIALVIALAALALAGPARAQDRAAILDSLQYTGFRFFWDLANPANGLCPDRSTAGSVCSIASTGFGLSSICIASDHGWVTREAARARVLTTLQTFWNGPQGPGTTGVIGYKGLYYHWLDMNTARRTWSSELSTIDTALLFAGILDCRQYFTGDDADETTIRALADSITHRAEWDWTRNGSQGIAMGWNPDNVAGHGTGFYGFGKWIGYNEAMIMYLIAIGSPTHPVPATDWNFWVSGYPWGQFSVNVGYYVQFAPLFGHQYSHCWVDFRRQWDPYMQLKGISYFENSRRATLSQIAYARQKGVFEQFFPTNHTYQYGYSDSLWGFTASDDPSGYAAHGAPSGYDNGTIAPTAAISSMPFAPESVWKCVNNMYAHKNSVYQGKLFPYWGPYGFGDAFNPEQTVWYGTAVLGIDQGPIVLMLENYRTNAVWQRCMTNPDLLNGLSLAGFTPIVNAVEPAAPAHATLELGAQPNPFRGSTLLRYRLPSAAHVRLVAYDVQGRAVATLDDGPRAAGEHTVTLDARQLAAGVYHFRLDADGLSVVRRAVLLQ